MPKMREFELQAKTEEESRQSTLLKALLAPQEESKKGKRKQHEQEAIRKAVERRLGPALQRRAK